MTQSATRWCAVLAAMMIAMSGAVLLNPGGAPAGPGIPGAGEITGTPRLELAAATGSCGRWDSPPKVVVHDQEFLDGGGDALTQAQMLIAINHVVDQFNQVGATSARVTSSESSADPFQFQAWYGDPTPTIHVGFTSDFAAVASADAAGVTDLERDGQNCHLAEAHILFPDLDDQAWNFNTPFVTDGDSFYDTRTYDSSDNLWFRPLFLHELLHAFGLDHTNDTYAFMNYPSYDGFPWANRDRTEAVRPLPADVRTLRRHYPQAGSRTEVAVLNTWFEPSLSDAADQIHLCQPSLGTQWGDPHSPGSCGVDGPDQGSRVVCAGDSVRTRFTLANYSTYKVRVATDLYYSTDDRWESGDTLSGTLQSTFDVPAAHSELQQQISTVPALTAGVDYYVIVRVVSLSDMDNDGNADSTSVRSDWMPLRGTVQGC